VAFTDIIGWLGSFCFAVCGIPQAIKTWKLGSADEISWLFLLLWLTGELSMIVYVWPKQDYPLLFNYLGNLACLLVILRFKLIPRSVS